MQVEAGEMSTMQVSTGQIDNMIVVLYKYVPCLFDISTNLSIADLQGESNQRKPSNPTEVGESLTVFEG